MQKGKNALYVSAGLQDVPGVRFNVRSSVHLPDSEAGRVFDPDRQPFRAEHVRTLPRESITVPLRGAMLFLCVLFVVFGCLIISKAARRSELSKRIIAMEQAIVKTEQDNLVLAAQVADARDPARICDAACQKLQMKAPSSDTTEHVIAPDTRPYENKPITQADVSPHAALDGIMTGSL